MTETLADAMKALRSQTGLSQRKLARLADVTKNTIVRIEGGGAGVRTETLRLLARGFASAGGHIPPDPERVDTILTRLVRASGPEEGYVPPEPLSALFDFETELARRYGSENAEFVDVVARKIQEFPPREAAFVRNLLMGAVRSADNPWRNSSDGTTEVVEMGRTLSSPRTY